MITLNQVKIAQPKWFSSENKHFFNDIKYQVVQTVNGQVYLLRSTYAFTDMFGQPKKAHYRLNPINSETHKIELLIDTIFVNIFAVEEWLKNN